MTSSIALEGLVTPGGNENRALAYIKVTIDESTYSWSVYVPPGVDLSTFLEESKDKIVSDILAKEAAWQALEPKTRTITDPMSDAPATVDIAKEEIVRPDIPDYYALRRAEYPPVADLADALYWQSQGEDTKMLSYVAAIKAIKDKYPKS